MFPQPDSNGYPQQQWGGFSFDQVQIKPYENEGFLDTVFNYRNEYIEAFHTLPHELKLKFYLSVEEMKMLGHMTDRPGYESILQQITRRVYFLHPDLQKPANTTQNHASWQDKMEVLLDGHLQKLTAQDQYSDTTSSHTHQNSNFLYEDRPNQPAVYAQTSDSKDDDDQFEWNEPVQNQIGPSPKEQEEDQFQWTEPVEIGVASTYAEIAVVAEPPKQQQQEEEDWEWNEGTNTQKQYHALALAVDKPPQQVINVWDIEVEEDSPQIHIPLEANRAQNYSQSNHASSQPGSTMVEMSSQNDHPTAYSTFQYTETQQGNYENEDLFTAYSYSKEPHSATLHHIGATHLPPSLVIHNSSSSQQNYFSSGNLQYLDGYGTQSDAKNDYIQQEYNIEQGQAVSVPQKHQEQDKQQENEGEDEFEWQDQHQNMPAVPAVKKQVTINSYVFDHSEQFGQPQPFQPSGSIAQSMVCSAFQWEDNVPSVSINLNSASNSGVQAPAFVFTNDDFLSSGLIDFSTKLKALPIQQSAQNQDILQVGDALQEVTYVGSYSFLPQNNQYEHEQILQPLKCQKSLSIGSKVLEQLGTKGFEYSRQFYPAAKELISQLTGNTQSKQYELLTDQQRYCNEIFRLTELYTEAVEEHEQDKLKQTLSQSKELHRKISPESTRKVLEKYLGLKGMGTNFHMGRLALQAGVPRPLIQKAAKSPKFKSIITALYVMECLGTLHSTPNYARTAIQYIQDQFAIADSIAGQLGSQPSPVLECVRQNPKFQQYRHALGQISSACKRAIVVGKICSTEQLHSNLLKIFKRMRELNPSPDNEIIICQAYIQTFQKVAMKLAAANVYTLYSEISQLLQKESICSICLLEIQEDEGARHTDDKNYHYLCWNFQAQVRRYKQDRDRAQLQSEEKQQEGSPKDTDKETEEQQIREAERQGAGHGQDQDEEFEEWQGAEEAAN